MTAALSHVNNFVHPRVIITDCSAREDTFFTKGIQSKARELETPLIELPPDAPEKLMWMTRLDSGSLRGKEP